MTDWITAAATRPDITTRVDRVIATMGSERQEAFGELRSKLTEPDATLSSDYEPQIDELAALDIESTQFETGYRELQTRIADDILRSGSK